MQKRFDWKEEGITLLLELIGNGEWTLDLLREASETDTGALLADLMRLEFKLLVERGPDQLYRLRNQRTR